MTKKGNNIVNDIEQPDGLLVGSSQRTHNINKRTFRLKQIFRIIARREGGHGVVVHTVVQRNEWSSPAGDGSGTRGGTRRGHRGGDQAERRRADHSTDSVHGADTRVGEHLQGDTNKTVCAKYRGTPFSNGQCMY